MILLDTCALIWWTLDPEKLSFKAREACSHIRENGALVSAISIWEIGIKIKNRALDIGSSIENYVRTLKAMNTLEFVPVDETIWMLSLSLDWNHRDPADRVIVATAQARGASIITCDRPVMGFYPKIIW